MPFKIRQNINILCIHPSDSQVPLAVCLLSHLIYGVGNKAGRRDAVLGSEPSYLCFLKLHRSEIRLIAAELLQKDWPLPAFLDWCVLGCMVCSQPCVYGLGAISILEEATQCFWPC